MTPKNIQAILRELYEIDPALKDHEQDLKPIIELLLKHDPMRMPDERFVQDLRDKLRVRASTLPTSSSIFSSFTMNNFIYALGGAVAAAVIAVPSAIIVMNQSNMPTGESGTPLFTYSVEEAGPNAFDLDGIQSNVRNQSGGGGGNPVATGLGDGGMPPVPMSEDAKLIAPDIYPPIFTNYTFAFDGELPELPQGTVSVFERQKNINAVTLASLADRFNLGLINLNAFQGANVDSIAFTQNREFGYMINLMLREGSISINQNWERWPHPENQCQDEACWSRYRLKPSDVISDEEAIRIATDFANEYDIDLEQFGTPEVQAPWRYDLARSSNPSEIYVPDAVTVVFPLLINGEAVYDEGGNAAGMTISVNNRQKRVSDMWGLQSAQYRKSDYAAVSDASAITDYLESIGQIYQGTYPAGSEVETREIALENPKIGYVRYYTYETGVNRELFVPAMIFDVVPSEGTYYYSTHVTVPLAQDVLDQFEDRRGGGVPIPLMMEAPAADTPVVAPAPREE